MERHWNYFLVKSIATKNIEGGTQTNASYQRYLWPDGTESRKRKRKNKEKRKRTWKGWIHL